MTKSPIESYSPTSNRYILGKLQKDPYRNSDILRYALIILADNSIEMSRFFQLQSQELFLISILNKYLYFVSDKNLERLLRTFIYDETNPVSECDLLVTIPSNAYLESGSKYHTFRLTVVATCGTGTVIQDEFVFSLNYPSGMQCFSEICRPIHPHFTLQS